MKLILVIQKFRNIIKNYRKYNKDIIYNKYFVNLIDNMIYDLLKPLNDIYDGYLEHLLLSYYPNQNDFCIDILDGHVKLRNYKEDMCFINDIELIDNNTISKINNYITLINELVYNDDELTERQKDKMNYIIFNKYIR